MSCVRSIVGLQSESSFLLSERINISKSRLSREFAPSAASSSPFPSFWQVKSPRTRPQVVNKDFTAYHYIVAGIILYTFTQFHSTPAIVTSILIGVGILFCGGAMVHNVFIWQKEKTTVFNCMKQQQHQINLQMQHHSMQQHNSSMHQPQPPLIARQTPLNLNLSMNSPISTIHNPVTNSSTREMNLEQINNHSYVNGGGLATLNNTHLSLLSQAVTPNSYFGLRTTPPTPKSQQLHNGSPNNSANLDQSNAFRNVSATTAHELSTLVWLGTAWCKRARDKSIEYFLRRFIEKRVAKNKFKIVTDYDDLPRAKSEIFFAKSAAAWWSTCARAFFRTRWDALSWWWLRGTCAVSASERFEASSDRADVR